MRAASCNNSCQDLFLIKRITNVVFVMFNTDKSWCGIVAKYIKLCCTSIFIFEGKKNKIQLNFFVVVVV